MNLIDRLQAITADMDEDELWGFNHLVIPALVGVLDELPGGHAAFDRAVAIAKGLNK